LAAVRLSEWDAKAQCKLGGMLNSLGKIVLVLTLIAILAASGWYAASAWVSVSGPSMPTTGYIAMTLGAVFSLIVGCGLMALLFYSNRHGYDEPYPPRDDRE